MRPRWIELSDHERHTYRAAVAFLAGRLEQRESIEWALGLHPGRRAERIAVLDTLNGTRDTDLSEPWRSAWRWIEESWNSGTESRSNSDSAYTVRDRIIQGDRSAALVSQIVDLVRPSVKARLLSKVRLSLGRPPHRPRSVGHLVAVELTSGELLYPAAIGLDSVQERDFLLELALALDAAVSLGLNIGRRLGWDGERGVWRLGMFRRAYFVSKGDTTDDHEPDKFHRGIAPAAKLLHAVVVKLADLDLETARSIAKRWQAADPLHLRSWAALARDSRLASAKDVGTFLTGCNNDQFWNLYSYPEIAELRATRFGELTLSDQKAVVARLKRKPPRSHWRREVKGEKLEEARAYWSVRELRRIEVAGAQLPEHQQPWFKAQLERFKDLQQMLRIEEGFMHGPEAGFVSPNPDDRYDLLSGTARLDALERALSSGERAWNDDPADRALDWIRQPGRADSLVGDLEGTADAGSAYPNVWDRFGWAHSPSPKPTGVEGEEDQERKQIAERVLGLLGLLSEETARKAIDGIANWISTWEQWIRDSPNFLDIWVRFWAIAVEATNAQQQDDVEPDLNLVARVSGNHEPMDLDTLNTPAGKLVGAMLAAYPSVKQGERPFQASYPLRLMRDLAIEAPARAGLIARHRMTEGLPWFLIADPEWTQARLLAPLSESTAESLALWRAIARRTHSPEVLKIIGEEMAARAADPKLGRETRSSLAWSVVLESLHAFREGREPVVVSSHVQQMLRSVDAEVRARAAEVVHRFVRDLSAMADGQPNLATPESLFRDAASPFLEKVWPQERSLATPGVARAFADLPAVCREAFVEAVEATERFLVPFECWSILDYGFFGEEDNGKPKISQIDDPRKAAALLLLLDKTIGRTEGAVVPLDLGSALDQVRKVAPDLVEAPRYRRLANLMRR